MSFMFNPCEYDDPNSINPIKVDKSVADAVIIGSIEVTKKIVENVDQVIAEKGKCLVIVDGYTTAEFGIFNNLFSQSASQKKLPIVIKDFLEVYQSSEELEKKFAENLPQDREADPVLLYGKLYHGGYRGMFDEAKYAELIKQLEDFNKNGSGILLLYGHGSMEKSVRSYADVTCWIDVTPKKAVLNVKAGKYKNIGEKTAKAFKLTMRRNYYVDFECAMSLRGEILKDNNPDWYIAGTYMDKMCLVDNKTMRSIMKELSMRPFRCRPVYLEGIWGGTYLTRFRNLPKEIRNCAWCFDMIPLEVSIVADFNQKQVEFPYFTFVQTMGNEIMGETCVNKFGGYFPIRFNYDDTWHSNGNMSIQLHPGHDYVTKNNNELGRQDESYYIIEAGQDAVTYCGFHDDADIDGFISDIKRSEKEHTPVDYKSYVNAVQSKPGVQVMIPAGTIHASGRNQLILEIGSLTVGSYTYKMYDYMRLDYDGNQRPIHSKFGAENINRTRRTTWVNENIVQKPQVIRKGADWSEQIVGQHDLLYFSLRTVSFETQYPDNTGDVFHVLTMVNGEHARVQSKSNPDLYFDMNYLDMVVVPHDVGEYTVINTGNQPITIHKTLLKDGFENDNPLK